MPVDRWKLLEWMAEREDSEPGRPTMTGADLMQQASGLAGEDGLSWDAVARATAYLERAGYIQWLYDRWPNDPEEPRAEFIDQRLLQRMREIGVTAQGRSALAQRQAKETGTQINIINSTVGHLAMGDIHNIDIFVVLDAMERSLAEMDISTEERDEAQTAIQRMRTAGGTVATSTVGAVLAAALRQALGLP